jgi:hypothetical protein
MKNFLRFLAVLLVFGFVSFVHAGNWISQVVQVGDMFTIDVPGDHVLVIKNFTQEFSGTSGRGTVTAMDKKTGSTATVLTATLADTNPLDYLEPVNEVVIAGPSTVTVTAGDSTGFITYRKAQD